MRRFVTSLLTATLLAACEGSGGPTGPVVQIVEPRDPDDDGYTAGAGIVDGTLRVRVAQNGTVVECGESCTAPVRNGSYELTLDIPSLEGLTDVQAWMEGDGDYDRIGAVPPFQPFGEGLDTGEVPVRLVMLEPDTCDPIELPGVRGSGRPRLAARTRDFAVVIRRNVALFVGGVEASGPGPRVGRFDQVVVETIDPLDSLDRAAGPARGLALSEDDSIVVADGGAWHFARNLNPQPGGEVILRSPLTVHEGADAGSSLVDLGDGAAVVGGSDSAEISWLSEAANRVAVTDLAVPRTAPAAALVAGGVLVVGGAAEGEPNAEFAELREDGRPLPVDAPGSGGWLIPSPSGASALWIGRIVDGSPTAATAIIAWTGDEWTLAAGPTWPEPRTGAAVAATRAGAFWILGGETEAGVTDAVDVVRWAGETPAIEAGPPLSTPRAGARAFEHASGIVTVVGGVGPDGLVGDFELCAPSALDPL